jgi:integrase
VAVIRERVSATGKKSYHVQVRIKGFPPQTKTFDTKTLAKQWASLVETEIRNGRWLPRIEAERHTVREALERYLEDVLEARADRRKTDEQQLSWWIAQFGGYSLAELTPSLIAKGRAELERPRENGKRLAPATVTRYLAILSSALSVIHKEWGWISESPMAKVRKPQVDNASTRFLATTELQRLLVATRASENPYLHTITTLAIATGMRKGEILSLRWRDVMIDDDPKAGLILLEKTKNDEPRGVPLVGAALAEVKRFRGLASEVEKPPGTALLFPSTTDPEQPIDIRKAWTAAVAAAKLDRPFRFHDCRHTAGSYLAMSGASQREIAEMLGHKDLAMVKRYSHLSKDHLQKVARRMNTKLGLLPKK